MNRRKNKIFQTRFKTGRLTGHGTFAVNCGFLIIGNVKMIYDYLGNNIEICCDLNYWNETRLNS